MINIRNVIQKLVIFFGKGVEHKSRHTSDLAYNPMSCHKIPMDH